MDQMQWKMKSKIGPLYLVATKNGLMGVFWSQHSSPLQKTLLGNEPQLKVLSKAVTEIEEYLEGDRKKFDLKLDLNGTPFQMKVWQQLAKIPYGETVSYLEIAKMLKSPKAARAVGTANGKNPLCIIIPCHRVIATNGSMGGYSGGLLIKSKLLKLEGIL